MEKVKSDLLLNQDFDMFVHKCEPKTFPIFDTSVRSLIFVFFFGNIAPGQNTGYFLLRIQSINSQLINQNALIPCMKPKSIFLITFNSTT